MRDCGYTGRHARIRRQPCSRADLAWPVVLRQRRRIFPHLDRQPAADGGHAGHLLGLGQDPPAAVFLPEHPARRRRLRLPRRPESDPARTHPRRGAAGHLSLCVRLLAQGGRRHRRAAAGRPALHDAVRAAFPPVEHGLPRPAVRLRGRHQGSVYRVLCAGGDFRAARRARRPDAQESPSSAPSSCCTCAGR